jgi:hypothetical protein
MNGCALRNKRDIPKLDVGFFDAAAYKVVSRAVMANIDASFAKRESLTEWQSSESIGEACKSLLAEFLEWAKLQTMFHKGIFTAIGETVMVKDRNNIIFELRNGKTIAVYFAVVTADKHKKLTERGGSVTMLLFSLLR